MFLNHDAHYYFCPFPGNTDRTKSDLSCNELVIHRFNLFFFFSRFFPSSHPSSGLRNNRTRIHKNLFVAMVIQVVIRLTVYIDQAIIRSGGKKGNESSRQGIDNTVSKYGSRRQLTLTLGKYLKYNRPRTIAPSFPVKSG